MSVFVFRTPAKVITGVLLCAATLFPIPALAQETGFEPNEFFKDEIENIVKGAIIGDVPSDDFNIVVTQVKQKFLSGRYATNKKYTPCQRAANAQAEVALSDLEQKWFQGVWFNVAYKAVKYSVVSAAGVTTEFVGAVLKEELRSIVADAVKSHIQQEAPEVVQLERSGGCNMKTVAVWDKAQSRAVITITGDCGCRTVKPRMFDLTSAPLKDFTVTIVAPVEIQVGEVKEGQDIPVTLHVKNLNVATVANCMCSVDQPPPPEEQGFVTGVITWITGLFDPVEEPEDAVGEPEDNTESKDEESEEGGPREAEEDKTEATGVVGLIGRLFGGDTAGDPRDSTDESQKEADDASETQEKPLMCGDTVNINGRSNVKTFPYTDENRVDANTQCGGTCALHQECRVVPESVKAFRSSCTYCHNVCNVGEFRSAYWCEQNKGTDQTCVPTGVAQCHTLQNNEPKPPKVGGSCEQAIRTVLDQYVGWFDPPLTVSANGAVFLNGPHRCLTESEFQQFHVQLVAAGVADSGVQAMCPSLKVVSNENIQVSGSGKGALCNTKTVFSF